MDQWPNFDAIIFDLDGTLWDSTAPVVQAWNETVAEVGGTSEWVVDSEAISGIMGMPHEQVFRKLLPNSDKEEREAFSQKFYPHESRRLKSEGGQLYPGVREGLEKLSQRFPLFIVSNCQPEFLKIFFATTKLEKFFNDSECHGNTGKSKAENISLVVRRFRLQSPVYIGDTASDQLAAERANVPFFHVEYGFGTPDRETLSFKDFLSLVAFLLND